MKRLSWVACAMVGAWVMAWVGCGSGSDTNATGAGTNGSGGSTSSSTTGTGMTATPTFESDIVPIFNKSCGAADNLCHSRVAYAATSSSECRGWLALEDAPLGSQIYGGPNDGQPTGCPDLPLYERLVQLWAWQECASGPKKYIVPCNVDASYLFDKIDDGPFCGESAPGIPSESMPKGKIMDPTERETIRQWILAGTPRDDGSAVDCNMNPMGQSPTANISHPGDGETRPPNMPIPFIGTATDPEDGALTGDTMVWTSDVTGQIGIGETFDAPLPAGVHVITLTATDSDGNTGTDSLTLNIQ